MYDIPNPTENDITNQLIIKYDGSFNELYNKITILNNSILTKESYIKKITDEIYNKEINILILYYSVFIALLILLVIFTNGYKIVSLGISLSVLVFFTVIISVYLYFKIKKLDHSYYFNKKLKNIKIDMTDYLVNNDDKKCPSTCTYKPPKKTMYKYLVDDEEMVYSHDLPYNSTPTLNIDDQTNVWQYGDSNKDKIYKSDILYGVDGESEVQYFDKQNNGLTYYECKWMGENNGILPNKENRYSSIPCSYRQNFKEINRYICTDRIDPNIDGLNKCEKIT